VPGPVQDKLLVAIGHGAKPQEMPFKTKIYADKEKKRAVFQAFKVCLN